MLCTITDELMKIVSHNFFFFYKIVGDLGLGYTVRSRYNKSTGPSNLSPFLELDISLRDHFIDRRDAKSDVACQTQISNSHKKREKSGIACRTIISMEGSKKVANE